MYVCDIQTYFYHRRSFKCTCKINCSELSTTYHTRFTRIPPLYVPFTYCVRMVAAICTLFSVSQALKASIMDIGIPTLCARLLRYEWNRYLTQPFWYMTVPFQYFPHFQPDDRGEFVLLCATTAHKLIKRWKNCFWMKSTMTPPPHYMYTVSCRPWCVLQYLKIRMRMRKEFYDKSTCKFAYSFEVNVLSIL